MSRNVCSDENGRFDKIFDKLMAHRIKGSQSSCAIVMILMKKIHKEYKGMNMQQMTEIVPFTCFYLRMI